MEEIDIVPHIGEFDFRANFTRTLSYETHVFSLLREQLHNYDAIVEIGANVGVYSVYFAKRRRDSGVPVFCFEPSSEAFRRLLVNLKTNEATENVFPILAAVSDLAGLVSFYQPAGHLTNGSLVQSFASSFASEVSCNLVACIDGASLVKLLEPYSTILLKIDVEGAEARVVHALAELLAKKHPEIILEVLEPFVSDLNAIEALFRNYRVYLVTPQGLSEKARFEAHSTFRDYYLVPCTRTPQLLDVNT